jgi:hypothetical protein
MIGCPGRCAPDLPGRSDRGSEKSGNWIDTGLGVVGAGLDALAIISDPVGALLQYGVAWIIEHVKPLSQALDWLAADPGQIAGHAQTWRNVAGSLRESAADVDRAVRRDVADWGGTAGPAYRAWAKQQQDAITGLGKAADTMAAITEGAGALIAAVRILVRDAIATCVSRLISYAAEEAFSIGFATRLVVEQVTTPGRLLGRQDRPVAARPVVQPAQPQLTHPPPRRTHRRTEEDPQPAPRRWRVSRVARGRGRPAVLPPLQG